MVQGIRGISVVWNRELEGLVWYGTGNQSMVQQQRDQCSMGQSTAVWDRVLQIYTHDWVSIQYCVGKESTCMVLGRD